MLQSLAKLTVNFQSGLSISDSSSEAVNSIVSVGNSCDLQQYCDTGCQTDLMGEVRTTTTPPCLSAAQILTRLSDQHRNWVILLPSHTLSD